MPYPEANHSDNKFQVTEIERTGAFVGRCAEICGTYHSMMNFEVLVVEPNDFKAYLTARTAGKTKPPRPCRAFAVCRPQVTTRAVRHPPRRTVDAPPEN